MVGSSRLPERRKRKAANTQVCPPTNAIRRAYQLIKIIYLSPLSNRGIQYNLSTEIVGFESVKIARRVTKFAEGNG